MFGTGKQWGTKKKKKKKEKRTECLQGRGYDKCRFGCRLEVAKGREGRSGKA